MNAAAAEANIVEAVLEFVHALGWFGIAIALGLLAALRVMLRRDERRRLRAPVVFLAAHLILKAAWAALPDGAVIKGPLYVASLFTLLLSMGRSGFLLAFDVVLGRKLNQPLPAIIRDIVQGLVYVGAALVTLRAAGVEAGSLLTTSALLTAIVGLSLQETLGNLFAGLSIQMQRPFDVGDWVQFDERPEHLGRVVEINWRATRVLSLDDVEVVIPNGSLAKVPIRNFSKPSPRMRRSVYVLGPYDVAPGRVEDVILRGLRGLDSVLRDPAPDVVVRELADDGVNYWVRFYIDDFRRCEAIDGTVRARIWYALQRSGISIPYPTRTVQLPGSQEAAHDRKAAADHARRLAALRHVDIFAGLPAEVLVELAGLSTTQLFSRGELIIRQGDEGDELYVIEHGEVVVLHHLEAVRADRTPLPNDEVARLGPGSFFGEMSLMTGALRTASIRAAEECEVVVVDKRAFQVVLDKSPHLAELVSKLLAERQARLESHVEMGPASRRSAVEAQSSALLEKIRSFFALS